MDRNQKWKGFYTAQDILDGNVPDQNHSYFFKVGEWKGEEDSEFVVNALTDAEVTEEDYEGRVYCVEVENHTFYTMCNDGHCLWSGNSSSLSGHDVTHNILDLRWEKNTLVGEMKLHLSPGFRRYGVCSTSGDLAANMILDGILIGVSSRGVGSVEQKFGTTLVSDDYELVCWDIVLEPSTPNAWISQNPKELEPFIESNTLRNKSELSEKLKKINKILLN